MRGFEVIYMNNIQLQLQQALQEIAQLKKENEYLKKLLSNTNILKENQTTLTPHFSVNNQSSPNEKIELFKSLFRGRNDTYAVRWESRDGRSGYTPACAFEWQQPICRKPEIKCSECQSRKLLPLTDEVFYNHLSGKQVIGIYTLQKDDTCSFLAVDFDKKSWTDDVKAFAEVCREQSIPFSIERSRSGNGAHVWIFFSEDIPASVARKMGMFLLNKALEKRFAIGLDSFDRLFPNQDTTPKGGFGNLIALPLQRKAKANGNSVFVNEHFIPYPDQWLYLSTVQSMRMDEIQTVLKNESTPSIVSRELYPKKVTLEMKNGIHVSDNLPSSLKAKLIKIATLSNPAFYKAQKSRMSTHGIPRILDCSMELDGKMILPRGCLEDVKDFFTSESIQVELIDHTHEGQAIEVNFNGELTAQQSEAQSIILQHPIGVLSATTGFGKTVLAASLIAERKVNTLIIVHRTQLMKQWIEQLSAFLHIPSKEIGQIGGGKNKVTGNIDIATIQSLNHNGQLKSFITQYGQVIVDECHHISAFSFEQVLKHIRAKYVHGLTATPIRKDGLHPIVFMQCGPIRYKIDGKTQAKVRPYVHSLTRRKTNFNSSSLELPALYRELAQDEERNMLIFNDTLTNLEEGRYPLILTERIEHIEILTKLFRGFSKNIIVLAGNLSKKEREQNLQRLASLPKDVERLVIATGKFIGEGFDHAPLDTLLLAMPISWKGTLQQYVGRLHRLHESKQEVRVYDYVDHNVEILQRMFEKRLEGYKSMGYSEKNEKKSLIKEQMRLF